MQAVMFKRETTVRGQHIPAGRPHLFFNSLVRQLAHEMDTRDLLVQDVPDLPMWDGKRAVRNMLVFAGGGLGDKIQSTCAFRKMAERIGCPVDVAIDTAEPWQNLPYVGTVHQWGIPWEQVQAYDAVCSFEDVLGHPNERTDHLADLLADRCMVGPLDSNVNGFPGEFLCDWVFGPTEQAATWLPPKESTWVAVQAQSYGFTRSWPMENIIRLCDLLTADAKRNINVLLLGTAGQGPSWSLPMHRWENLLPDPPQGIVNLCGFFSSIRQVAVLLRKCDLLIAPDSGLLHLAGALSVPAIGLYGPHTYETRGKYFLTQNAIIATDTTDPRCPCHCHSDQQMGQAPCGLKYCRLMAQITPDMVMEEVNRLADLYGW